MNKVPITLIMLCWAIFLSACNKITPSSQSFQQQTTGTSQSTVGATKQFSLAEAFFNKIPNCLPDFTGTIVYIDDVVTNCTTKKKQGTMEFDLGGVEAYYRIFNGQVWAETDLWISPLDNDDTFMTKAKYLYNRNQYICKYQAEDWYWIGVIWYTYTWDSSFDFSTKDIKKDFLLKHPILGTFSFIYMYNITHTYCPLLDPDCKNMKTQWFWTDGTNYFLWWGQQADFLINDVFYDNWNRIQHSPENFETEWAFETIKNNNIIVKKMIDGKMIDDNKSTYILKTCEIPLP